MSEPSPGVYTFEMFQPHFCELLLHEVENFENWVNEAKFRIMRPNTMNKFGAVLDDFGLETMLDKLMEGFIRPISKVFFSEVGGSTLDSHHGFVVEYGKDRDVDLGRSNLQMRENGGKCWFGVELCSENFNRRPFRFEWKEGGRVFKLELRNNNAGGWKILASKLRNIGVVPAHSPLKLPQGDVYHRRECAAHFPRKGASFANAIFRGKGWGDFAGEALKLGSLKSWASKN
ncbi:putative PKHD-type hydroxylase [Vitis vinifera]|uniref:Putative PKHD-type hydroxylase n=1 Tax=Vitis vinifera TaxID=29760 RepID=A0A438K976_VITVI|nr:putative PKHD-type hydroxylase [Vitis vinifera]